MRCDCGGALFLGRCEACGREAVAASGSMVSRFVGLYEPKPNAETWVLTAHLPIVIDDQVDDSQPVQPEASPPQAADWLAKQIEPIRSLAELHPKAAELLDLALANQRIADLEAQIAALLGAPVVGPVPGGAVADG